MAKISVLNPLPFHIGGASSPTETVYRSMRKALGVRSDGSDVAGPVGSVEDEWRIAKARVLGRERQRVDLAFRQFFPDRATVALGEIEEELDVSRAATEPARQEAVAGVYTNQLEAVIPQIRRRLRQIDDGLDVVTWNDDTKRTRFGRVFVPRSGSPVWNQDSNRKSSLYPNFASEFVLVVLWTGLADGIPSADKRREVTDYLDQVLPAWCDWTIANGVGFYLDGFNNSRLDLTAFGS